MDDSVDAYESVDIFDVEELNKFVNFVEKSKEDFNYTADTHNIMLWSWKLNAHIIMFNNIATIELSINRYKLMSKLNNSFLISIKKIRIDKFNGILLGNSEYDCDMVMVSLLNDEVMAYLNIHTDNFKDISLSMEVMGYISTKIDRFGEYIDFLKDVGEKLNLPKECMETLIRHTMLKVDYITNTYQVYGIIPPYYDVSIERDLQLLCQPKPQKPNESLSRKDIILDNNTEQFNILKW